MSVVCGWHWCMAGGAWLAAVHGWRRCGALPAMTLGILSAACGWGPTLHQGSVAACCLLGKGRLLGHSLI